MVKFDALATTKMVTEAAALLHDKLVYGVSYTENGKRVDPERVHAPPERSEADLMKLSRPELIVVAGQYGMTVKSKTTKAQMTEFILAQTT